MRGVERIIFFIGSPFLTVPINLFGVLKKSNLSLKLLALTIGFLSFLYIPNWSDDKVVYYQLYTNCKLYGFSYLLDYLSKGRPDFILHTIVYLFAALDINFSWFFFAITSWTVWVSLRILNLFPNTLSNKSFFFGFLLIFISFSLPDLFSGIRFYFAASFVLLGLYEGIVQRSKFAILYLFIAIFIHFSTVLFLPVYLILRFFKGDTKIFRTFFLLSFAFMLIPKSFVAEILKGIGLSGGYEQKANTYLGDDDFIENGINKGSANYIYVYLMSISWSFFSYLYLVFVRRSNSLFRNITYVTYSAVNIFFSVTTVYARYLLVAKTIFIMLFIYDQIEKPSKKLYVIFIGTLVIGIIANIIVMRINIMESYFNFSVLSLLTIFFKTISYENFL